MTIEQSHGKARPTLPRASDLAPVPRPEGDPRQGRDEHGRFAPGNTTGRGRGWRHAIAKQIGRAVDDPIARAVAGDAWRLYSAALRELPNDGATVRGLAALKCRHEALAAFWNAEASSRGFTTDEGLVAQEQATKHGQRAERLTVTMLDVATKLAKKKDAEAEMDLGVIEAQAEAEASRRRSAGAPGVQRAEDHHEAAHDAEAPSGAEGASE